MNSARTDLHTSYIFHIYAFLCFLIEIQQFALTSFRSKAMQKLQKDGCVIVTLEFL